MADHGQQQNSRPFLLLAGFIVLSVILHGLFLAYRFDDKRDEVELVQIAPPLHVIVVSSRKSSTSDNESRVTDKAAERSANQQGKQAQTKTTTRTVAAQRPAKAKPVTSEKPVQSTASPMTRKSYTNTTKPDQLAKAASQQAESTTEMDIVKPVPVNHLQAQIRSQLARHFTYPRLARRMGWEGQVGIGLHIGKDGRLGKIQVVRSSGYKVLDENARSTLYRIGHITVASNRTINPVDTEIDVLYRLKD